MRAAVIDAYGGPERLEVREVDRPEAGPGEVLIRVRAAGVNPVDRKIRGGMLRAFVRPGFPMILGGDAAGEVADVGPGVDDVKAGDHVFAMLDLRRGRGAYAQYAAARASSTAPIPDCWSFEEAAAVPIAGLTALQALRDLGRLEAGGSALINGASGGVGTFAVQVARALGARVVGTCAADAAGLVRTLGADEVLDYARDDFTRRSDRFDVVLDAAAKARFGRAARILAPTGAYVSTLPDPGLFAWKAALMALRLVGVRKRAYFIIGRPSGADLRRLAEYAMRGVLRPVIDRTFRLEDVREAHAFIERGHPRGKVVLTIDGDGGTSR